MNDCIGDNTLVEFVEGALSTAQSSLLERHIARCDTCRHRVAAMGASPSRVALDITPLADDAVIIEFDEDDGAPKVVPGSRVENYDVRHEIGRGGMGVVFSARDAELDRPVALKLLHNNRGGANHAAWGRERLLAEARAMARLSHPHIVTVYGAGHYGESAYIAMEMIVGETLSGWLERWRRPWPSILDAFRQAGEALSHAHGHGLAHGDFKPENILVDDKDHVRVTDFGLACRLDSPFLPGRPGWVALPVEVEEHPVMGTPRYMAPEQFTGHPADVACDQFSYCVALYEALYGQHPFAGERALSLLELSEDEAARSLRERAGSRPDIPDWIQRALCRGLHVDPAQRWPSMKALLEALAVPQRRRYRAPRAPMTALLGVAMALLCATGYALGAWYSQQRSPARVAGDGGGEQRWPVGDEHGSAGVWERARDASQVPVRTDQAAIQTVDLALALALANPELIPARFVNLRTILGAHGAQRASIVTLIDGTMVLFDRELERMHEVRDAVSTLDDWLGEPTRAVAQIEESLLGEPERPERASPERRRPLYRDRSKISQIGARADEAPVAGRNGLDERALRAGMVALRSDLKVCFREWRERQPRGSAKLAVRLVIDTDGRARARRVRGLDDRVVQKCAVGALERGVFASAPYDTYADVWFVSTERALRIEESLVSRANHRD